MTTLVTESSQSGLSLLLDTLTQTFSHRLFMHSRFGKMIALFTFLLLVSSCRSVCIHSYNEDLCPAEFVAMLAVACGISDQYIIEVTPFDSIETKTLIRECCHHLCTWTKLQKHCPPMPSTDLSIMPRLRHKHLHSKKQKSGTGNNMRKMSSGYKSVNNDLK